MRKGLNLVTISVFCNMHQNETASKRANFTNLKPLTRSAMSEEIVCSLMKLPQEAFEDRPCNTILVISQAGIPYATPSSILFFACPLVPYLCRS